MKQMLSIRKGTLCLLSALLLCSSCGTTQQGMTDPQAVLTGAAIGGNVGSALGGLIGESNNGWRGGYRGSAIGSIVGTLAGAAIGGAISSARQREPQQVEAAPSTPFNEVIDRLRISHVRLIDDDRDHVISSGESCKIIFEIMNEDPRTACNVVPVVSETSGMKRIQISPSVMVEQIKPHEGVKYTATLTAGKRIKEGTMTIRIAICDEFGQEYDWQEFNLDTRR